MADSASESSSAREVEPGAWKFRNSETSACVLDKAGMEAARKVQQRDAHEHLHRPQLLREEPPSNSKNMSIKERNVNNIYVSNNVKIQTIIMTTFCTINCSGARNKPVRTKLQLIIIR